MGHFILGMLLPLFLQASPPSTPPQPGTTSVVQAETQSTPMGAEGSPSSPRTSPASGPESQESINQAAEQPTRSAATVSDSPSDENPEISPETERAIEEAVDAFLSDPEIKTRIAEVIRQGPSVAEQGIRFGLISTILFFATVALIAWMLYRRSQTRMRARMEFHQQVLSKFSSGQEFAAFLNTRGSEQMLAGMWGDQVNLRARLLKHVRLGAIFGVIGLGLLGLAMFDDSDYGFLAVLSLGIGIGFLISARVSYRLSEKMGFIQDKDSRELGNENSSDSES